MFPFESTNASLVSSVLWGDDYWMEKIFDTAAYLIKRTHVDALFLSLHASRILRMERASGKVRWNVTWISSDVLSFTVDDAWSGVHLHRANRPRDCKPRTVQSSDLVTMQHSLR